MVDEPDDEKVTSELSGSGLWLINMPELDGLSDVKSSQTL